MKEPHTADAIELPNGRYMTTETAVPSLWEESNRIDGLQIADCRQDLAVYYLADRALSSAILP